MALRYGRIQLGALRQLGREQPFILRQQRQNAPTRAA